VQSCARAKTQQLRIGRYFTRRRRAGELDLHAGGREPRAGRGQEAGGGGQCRIRQYRDRRDIDFAIGVAAVRAVRDRHPRRLARELLPLNVEEETRKMQSGRAVAGDAAQYVRADFSAWESGVFIDGQSTVMPSFA
jgi:hypothetical protein